MVVFMDTLRVMHGDDPLALEVCVRHVASAVEDQRRGEGRPTRGISRPGATSGRDQAPGPPQRIRNGLRPATPASAGCRHWR
jgi:hypothetical protein